MKTTRFTALFSVAVIGLAGCTAMSQNSASKDPVAKDSVLTVADTTAATQPAPAAASPARQRKGPAMEKVSYLGLNLAPVPEALAAQLGLPAGQGMLVTSVDKNGPADKAGLKKYDIIQKVNDQILFNTDQYTSLIRTINSGDTATLAIIHQGKTVALPAVVGQKEIMPAGAQGSSTNGWMGNRMGRGMDGQPGGSGMRGMNGGQRGMSFGPQRNGNDNDGMRGGRDGGRNYGRNGGPNSGPGFGGPNNRFGRDSDRNNDDNNGWSGRSDRSDRSSNRAGRNNDDNDNNGPDNGRRNQMNRRDNDNDDNNGPNNNRRNQMNRRDNDNDDNSNNDRRPMPGMQNRDGQPGPGMRPSNGMNNRRPGAMSTTTPTTTMVFADDTGTLKLTIRGDQKRLVAKDKDGKVTFDGPVSSDTQRKALTPDLAKKLQTLENAAK